MKSLFSTSWKRSVQPRKQRKYLANLPNHLKHKLLSTNLDKSLRTKLKLRSLEVRKGDEVKVMRGKYTKKTGKILGVDYSKTRVKIDGITISKKDGEKVPVWFHPSNLKIVKLDDSDKKRIRQPKKVEEAKAKPEVKKVQSTKETKNKVS